MNYTYMFWDQSVAQGTKWVTAHFADPVLSCLPSLRFLFCLFSVGSLLEMEQFWMVAGSLTSYWNSGFLMTLCTVPLYWEGSQTDTGNVWVFWKVRWNTITWTGQPNVVKVFFKKKCIFPLNQIFFSEVAAFLGIIIIIIIIIIIYRNNHRTNKQIKALKRLDLEALSLALYGSGGLTALPGSIGGCCIVL